MFEVPKPLSTLGIGVDKIPDYIRWSKVLTGNDLGMLGNVEKIPSKGEVAEFVASNRWIRAIISADDEGQLHRKAQEYLDQKDILAAWKILLAQEKNQS